MNDAIQKVKENSDWNRLFERTNWNPESAKIAQDKVFYKPPYWIRSEKTASFCIYPDGRAHDFGTGTSYNPFQLYMLFLGLDSSLALKDPRRIEAAREFWPERYGGNRFGGLDRKGRRRLIGTSMVRAAANQKSLESAGRKRVPAEQLMQRSEAWIEIGKTIEQTQPLALAAFAKGRSLDIQKLKARSQKDVFGLSSLEDLYRFLVSLYGKEKAIVLLLDAGLLVKGESKHQRRVFGPSACLLFNSHLEGFGLVPTDVRIRPLVSSGPKELGLPKSCEERYQDRLPPGFFGLEKEKAIERYAGSLVVLTESPCDTLAMEELFWALAESLTNRTLPMRPFSSQISFLGLSGTSTFQSDQLRLIKMARELILAFDNDSAGKACGEKVLAAALSFDLKVSVIPEFTLSGASFKDPNDLLRSQKKNPADDSWAPEVFTNIIQG